MVPLRHSPADPRHGGGIPRLRDGGWAPMDGQPETLPDPEHTSRIQRLPSSALPVYVL